MTVTESMIAKLRRMINEPTQALYTDAALDEILTENAVTDPDGQTTYDLNAAAADVWSEKAALIADEFDFNADGGSFQRSQKYDAYMKNARHYGSRRKAKSRPLAFAEDTETDE